MKVLIDTCVFISLIEEGDGNEYARKLLNKDWELCTSLLNLMEMRTFFIKKRKKPQEDTEKLIQWIAEHLEIVIDSDIPIGEVEDTQKSTLLYPMDCIIYHISNEIDAECATFDGEIKHHGGVDPETLVS